MAALGITEYHQKAASGATRRRPIIIFRDALSINAEFGEQNI
jgi:hypothetical protein